jgi:N-acetylglucosaminyldiphosphoundecaprenol N-acetyl-beta-D-mannosaminyltransferase
MTHQPISKQERIKILGVPFDSLKNSEALALVLERIAGNDKHFFIATPNPEMLLEARKNAAFREVLNKTDLNIPDGFGIMLAARVSGKPLKERITGTDLMQEVCRHAPEKTKIFLLGAAPGVAQKTGEILEKRCPNIKIAGTYGGSPAREEENHIRHLINESGAEVLFVAFGAPKQEIWLAGNLPPLTHVKVAMGVGGAFDFISGTIKRAPVWMRKLGLEWLYRLIKQPSRTGRIFNATIIFPLIFLASLFRKH